MRYFLALLLIALPLCGRAQSPGGGGGGVALTGTNGIQVSGNSVGIYFPVQNSALTGTLYNVANSDGYTTLSVNSSAITINFAAASPSYLAPGTPVCFSNQGSGNATLVAATGSVFKGATLTSGNFVLVPNANWCVQTDASDNYVLTGYNPPVSVPASIAPAPQGRLTLSSGVAVQKADVTSATTIYYVPYVGPKVPAFGGTALTQDDIGTGISLSVSNPTNFPASTLFDAYVIDVTGTPTLCAVPWGTSTAGSSSRGSNVAITNAVGGLWTNSGAWTCYNGGTSYTLVTNQATLLGTFLTTPAGAAVTANLHPAAAAGGPTNGATLGYANIYNQVPVTVAAKNSDSFTTTTTGILLYDVTGSAAGLYDRVTWVDPLGQMDWAVLFTTEGHAPSGQSEGITIALNNVTPTATGLCAAGITAGITSSATMVMQCAGNPPQSSGGLNYVQGLTLTGTGTNVFGGTSPTFGSSTLQSEMLRLSGYF